MVTSLKNKKAMRIVSIIILLFIGFTNYVHSTPAIDIVRDFGKNLENWCKTKDSKYQLHLESLVASQEADGQKCRISDRIINENAPDYKIKDIGVYTMIFKSRIHDGISVNYSNIKIDYAPEFSTPVFGQSSDTPVCVSCDIHVEGALNYDTKDIFYIRNGKIVAIGDYYADMTFNNAILLLKQKRYQDALDIFEEILSDPKTDSSERVEAKYFALSILLKRSKDLIYGKYARSYKIAHLVAKWNYFGHPTKSIKTPLLTKKNYDIALRSVKGSKDRKYHLPSGLNKAIPYNYITNDNSQIGFYYSYVFCDYRPIAKKRFTILKDGKYGYVDEHDAIVIPAQYQFAYPFDEKVGLALVKQFNGGWGYIDMQGVPRTKLDYSECSDVWYNNKTYVITGSTVSRKVQLIDVHGNVLRQLSYWAFTHARPCSSHGEEILMLGDGESDALVDFEGNIIRDKNSFKYRSKEYSLPEYLSLGMYKAWIVCGGCDLNLSAE